MPHRVTVPTSLFFSEDLGEIATEAHLRNVPGHGRSALSAPSITRNRGACGAVNS